LRPDALDVDELFSDARSQKNLQRVRGSLYSGLADLPINLQSNSAREQIAIGSREIFFHLRFRLSRVGFVTISPHGDGLLRHVTRTNNAIP
jgi:hypothetical protein